MIPIKIAEFGGKPFIEWKCERDRGRYLRPEFPPNHFDKWWRTRFKIDFKLFACERISCDRDGRISVYRHPNGWKIEYEDFGSTRIAVYAPENEQ